VSSSFRGFWRRRVVLLDEFTSDPPAGFLKAERYVNVGSPSGLDMNTTSERTQPRANYSSFDLCQVRFRDGVLLEDLGYQDVGRYAMQRCMFIHPDMLTPKYLLDTCYSVEAAVAVAPTASGRTVLVLDGECFIKLAYLEYLGRLIRHIRKEMVLSACEVTQQLIAALRSGNCNNALGILREDCGRVAYVPPRMLGNARDVPLNESGCYEWGVLFRDARPYPYREEGESMIPFFALLSQEYSPVTKSPLLIQDKPLLIQLFERQGRPMPVFLLESILFPLFNSYFDALLLAGVALEAHAQNMLVTIDQACVVRRIICRDFESAGRDVPVMKTLGIDYVRHGDYKCNDIRPCEPGQKYPKYYINHSFMFDFKLGEYLVTPLIDLAHRFYPFDQGALIAKIKEFNRQFVERLPDGFFPQDWCRYENVNWDQEGRAREYIWQDHPKYR
jgi:hypothetical protein